MPTPPAPAQVTAVAGIHDAVERVVPSLADEQSRAELRAALTMLADTLAGPDTTTPDVFRPARHAIDGLATGGDGAELDAIRLTLDFAIDAFNPAARTWARRALAIGRAVR